jgi:hypothetical protein
MAADALTAAAHAGLLPASEPATAHLALLQDVVLIAAARNATTARAALDDPDFQSHCRRYTQARNADDVLFRRVRLGELDTAGSAGNTGKGAAAAAP